MSHEVALPADVVAEIERFTENDFRASRLFVADEFTHMPLEDLEGLQVYSSYMPDFKKRLQENVAYFAEKLAAYKKEGVQMIVFNGTSALSYRQMFHEAYKEYHRLHPKESIHIPQMAFVDAHPLRALAKNPGELPAHHPLRAFPFDYEFGLHVADYVSHMDTDAIKATWKRQAGHVLKTIKAMRALPEGSPVVIFDEASNPMSMTGSSSLLLIHRFLQGQVPTVRFNPQSPANESLGARIIIRSDHIARVIKRPDDYLGGDPTALVRPVYGRRNTQTGLSGHTTALRLSKEARMIGRLIARAM